MTPSPLGKLLFETIIEPRWSDQDRLGHINNAEYFRYFEEARIRWLNSLSAASDRQDSGPVLAATSCNYLHSIIYPCPLTASLYTAKVGNSSFTLQQRLVSVASGKLFAEGSCTLVWVRRENGKPISIPTYLRSILE